MQPALPVHDRSPKLTTDVTVERVAIVIPACDEVETIVGTLDSVQRAADRLPATLPYSLVVVADGCGDETAAVARRWSAEHWAPCTVVECSERSAGAARALGTSRAVDDATRRGVAPNRLWLAHTDADTVVPTDWLTLQLDIAASGVDAIAGVVQLDESAPTSLAQRFRAHYHLGPDRTHHHVHGANIAMRASAYLDAGGWDARPTGEDHDLWRRLRNVAHCVSSTSIVVCTSSRIVGRAPHGFAADVRSLCISEIVA